MKHTVAKVCRAARCKVDGFMFRLAAAYVIVAAIILVFNDSDG